MSGEEFLLYGVAFGLLLGIFHGLGLDLYSWVVAFLERRGWL